MPNEPGQLRAPTIVPRELLFNEVPCYISVQDRDFHIIQANRRFIEAFGEPEGDFCWKVYKKRNDPCLVCPVARTFEDGTVHSSEEFVSNLKGEPICTLVQASPIADESGTVVAVMEVSTDITEIRRLQSKLTSVGELVTGLAHTVKGIVMGLDGGMYVVDSGFRHKKDEVVQKGWDMVHRNVERVSHLVLDILYYAKDREPEWGTVDLVKLCDEICDLYEKKLSDSEVLLVKSLPVTALIKGDARALHSLFLNLMENALDACKWDKNKAGHRIEVTIRPEEVAMLVTVADNGVGMDAESRSKVFTPFFSSKKASGTGLGLLIAHKVVQEHRGTIEVASEEGAGTVFTLRLPMAGGEAPG